jgi:hypothetical protein
MSTAKTLFFPEKQGKNTCSQLTAAASYLVPKLRLGMLAAKLRFARPTDSKQSFEPCVPKQSLGTRIDRRIRVATCAVALDNPAGAAHNATRRLNLGSGPRIQAS